MFHQVFIATSILTWWPILSPLRELPPLAQPAQLIYLFGQTLPTGLLGALFTFAEAPLYPPYVAAPRVWSSFSPLADQQLGGLIMWVIGGTFFLGAFALVFLGIRDATLRYDEGGADAVFGIAPHEHGFVRVRTVSR